MDFSTSHHLGPPLLVGEVLLVAESGYLSCWSTPGCSGVWVGTELPHMFNHFQLSKCAEFHAYLTPGPQKTIAQKWSRTSVLTDVLHFTWVIGTLFGCHLQTSHSVIQTLHHSTHGGLQVGFLSSKKKTNHPKTRAIQEIRTYTKWRILGSLHIIHVLLMFRYIKFTNVDTPFQVVWNRELQHPSWILSNKKLKLSLSRTKIWLNSTAPRIFNWLTNQQYNQTPLCRSIISHIFPSDSSTHTQKQKITRTHRPKILLVPLHAQKVVLHLRHLAHHHLTQIHLPISGGILPQVSNADEASAAYWEAFMSAVCKSASIPKIGKMGSIVGSD